MSVTVFFDGECRLCNQVVDFLLREDQQGLLRYAPLQGSTAKHFFSRYPDLQGQDSLLVWIQDQGRDKALLRSDATLFLGTQLPRFVRVARLGYFVPRPLRDFLYRLVARFRFQIWGKLGHCRVPSAEEAQRFLP